MLRIASQRVLLPTSGGLAFGPARIEVDGTQIVAVHPSAGPHPDDTIDFGDKGITPSFINAHLHLALSFLRGVDLSASTRGNMVENLYYRIERKLASEDVRAFARMGAYESLLFGVGLVWDHYYHPEAIADALEDTGLAGVIAPTLQDLDGPGIGQLEANLAATEGLAQSEARKRRGIYAALGPHATDTLSEAGWRAAVALAQRHDLPIHAHLAQSVEEYARAEERHGHSPTEWLANIGVLDEAPKCLFAHALYCGDADLDRLAQSGATIAYCPYSQMIFGFPADPRRWLERGVSFVAATDCTPSNDSMNVQKELRALSGQRTIATAQDPSYAAFTQAPSTARAQAVWRARSERFDACDPLGQPEALLSRVWSEAGGLHPGFRAGAIAPDTLANLLVWDFAHPAFWPGDRPLSTLALGDTAGAIHAHLVAGRWVGEPGRYHDSLVQSPEYRAAHREASERQRALLTALPA